MKKSEKISSQREDRGPLGETKVAKFERIAQRRVTELVAKIRLISNLSDRRNYDFTDEHVRQIFDALDSEIRACKGKFRSGDASAPVVFSFKR
jgi:hypothetical protein